MPSSCCGRSTVEDNRGREGTVRITRTRREGPDSSPGRKSKTRTVLREKEKRGRRKKRDKRSIEVPGMKLLVALSAMDDRVSVRVSISTAILVAEHLNEMSVVSVFSYRDAFHFFFFGLRLSCKSRDL